ncbi:DUF4269 domain-containing protein [Acaryochloris sp. 'Moss Beach']|uniref:DUF4269 domain-containing protein n=1 Tax=Acaryochloris TaxID=155977 RepID=UPI001F245A80|nr:DUF4269 domain-containing protein [Acaryochloris sp. 'Moss Beach']UJB67643.1 DUF4269 domain-containing protein [Acaryochloris sp. 'Moss Beach']
MNPDFEFVIESLGLLNILHDFNPCIIGTPPLGIDISTSDIDIACSAKDLSHFRCCSHQNFGKLKDYRCYDSIAQNLPAVIVQFHSMGWELELFCQTIPTEQQWGVRHFRIEQRLLELEPRLRIAVQQLKQKGIKTEPAFAQILGLEGDPYIAMLELEQSCDGFQPACGHRNLKHLISTKLQ